MAESTLVVNRWRRHGKDRLYVERADGAKIGWWDLTADEAHPARPEDLPALRAALMQWRESPAPAPTPRPRPQAGPMRALERPVVKHPEPSRDDASAHLIPHPTSSPEQVAAPAAPQPKHARQEPARPWMDLAANRAGAMARNQAVAARQGSPVKSALARLFDIHTDERAWRIGADGEEKVAAQLAKVAKRDPRWRFLHAVPVGERGSDIDHVIIGPGGIFTVNTKNHPNAKIWVAGNTFMVNGSRQYYVRNSKHEANRAARLLSTACGFPLHVEGLVVPVNAADVVVKSQPDGVSVVPRMQLAGWLLRHGDTLTGEQLSTVFEIARRSTTWR